MTLFSALMIGATGTFTSCKDYDDDIKNLQEQLGKKASLEELAAKVSTLETAVNDAKTAANEAKDKAQEALDKAGSAEGGVSDDDLKALKKELQDQNRQVGFFGHRKPKDCGSERRIERRLRYRREAEGLGC